MFLPSSIPATPASAVHHFFLPPTPLLLRFSLCLQGLGYFARFIPTDPCDPFSGSRGTAALEPATSATQPAVDYGFGPGIVSRRSSFWDDPPKRVRRPRRPSVAWGPSGPNACPDGTRPVGPRPSRAFECSTFRAPDPFGPPSAPTADLDALGAAADLHFGDTASRYSHADWAREQQEESMCYVANQYILPGRALALPTEVLAHFPSAPLLLGDSGARRQRPPPHYRRGHYPPRPCPRRYPPRP